MTKVEQWFNGNVDNDNVINNLITDMESADVSEEQFRDKYTFSSSSARTYLEKLKGIKVKCKNKGNITANNTLNNDDVLKITITPKTYGNKANKVLRFTVSDDTYTLITNMFPNLSKSNKQQVNEQILLSAYKEIERKKLSNKLQVVIPPTEERVLEL